MLEVSINNTKFRVVDRLSQNMLMPCKITLYAIEIAELIMAVEWTSSLDPGI